LNVDLKARLGDLSGIGGNLISTAVPGYGLYSDNVYLRGHIEAKTGDIGHVTLESGSIYVGDQGFLEGWAEGSDPHTSGFVSQLIASMSGEPILQQLRASASRYIPAGFGTYNNAQFWLQHNSSPGAPNSYATTSKFVAKSGTPPADNLSDSAKPIYYLDTGTDQYDFIVNELIPKMETISASISAGSQDGTMPWIFDYSGNAFAGTVTLMITSSIYGQEYPQASKYSYSEDDQEMDDDYLTYTFPFDDYNGRNAPPAWMYTGTVGNEIYNDYAGFFMGFDTGSIAGEQEYLTDPGGSTAPSKAYKFGFYGGTENKPEFLVFDGSNVFLQGTVTSQGESVAGWETSDEAIWKSMATVPAHMVRLAGYSSWLKDYPQVQLSASAIFEGSRPLYLPVITIHDGSGRAIAAMGHYESQSLGIYGISGEIGSWELSEYSMSKLQSHWYADPDDFPDWGSNWTGDHYLATQSRRMSFGSDDAPVITDPILRPGEPRVYNDDTPYEIFIPVTHSKYFKVTWEGDCEIGDDLGVGEWIRHLGDTGSWNPADHQNPDFIQSGSFLQEHFGPDVTSSLSPLALLGQIPSGGLYNPKKLYTGLQFPSDQWEIDFQVGGMDVIELKGPSRGKANEPSYSIAFLEATGSCNWKMDGKSWDPPSVLIGFPVGAPASQSTYYGHDEIRFFPGNPAAPVKNNPSNPEYANGGYAPDEGLVQFYSRVEIVSHSIEAWMGNAENPGYSFDGDSDSGMYVIENFDGNPGEEALAVSTDGIRRMTWEDNGKIRIYNHNTSWSPAESIISQSCTILLDGAEDDEGNNAGKIEIYEGEIEGNGTRIFRLDADDRKFEMQNGSGVETIEFNSDQGDHSKFTLKDNTSVAQFQVVTNPIWTEDDVDFAYGARFVIGGEYTGMMPMDMFHAGEVIHLPTAGDISLGDEIFPDLDDDWNYSQPVPELGWE
jgi:hypothetical protein